MTRRVRSLGLALDLLALLGASTAQEPPRPPARRALLVGCTRYQLASIRELWGPANDAPMWSRLLVGGFGFREADITRLVGWPDDPAGRPTRDNIAAALDRLVAQSAEGDQVVIILSGHGAQVPVDPARQTPDNFEPDGLDEVFLPADVREWTPQGVKNAILDDEIGAWLDRLKAKGAHVWIVFDSCHSGTMTRGGGPDDAERPRTIRPEALGIPDRALADAAAWARTHDKEGNVDPGPARPGAGRGSVVAFYAAQPFEESPELPRPAEAPQVRENYYGLFSYTLTEALSRRRGPLSYRELAHDVATRYRADRRSRPPTAFAEGDLDREVMGSADRPGRPPMSLSRGVGGLSVDAGGLLGVAAGTLLSVHPPADDPRPAETILGYVRVVDASPFAARVAPVAHGDLPAVAGLPDGAVCRPVERSLGDARVSLALVAPSPAAARALRDALAGLPEATRALVAEPADPSRAEWWLQVVGDAAHLRHGPGRSPSAAGDDGPTFERYPLADPSRLASAVGRDLAKLYRWQALWRVAGAAPPSTADEPGLRLEVLRAPGPAGATTGPIEAAPTLRPGDWIEIRLTNDGRDDLWVSLLSLDARFGITPIPVGSVRAGRSARLPRLVVGDDAFGPEGLVAFGTPIEAARDEPDFRFLEQEPLGQPALAQRLRGGSGSSPFTRLLESAALGESSRGLVTIPVAVEPRVAASTWVTVRPILK